MIRVLIVEDSATVRRLLRTVLSSSAGFEVVGEVASADEAVLALQRLAPDLISLDVFLPGMPAAQLVSRILATRPVPIILVSDADRDAREVFEALAAGALDFVPKPRAGEPDSIRWMVDSFRVLSEVQVRRRPPRSAERARRRVRPEVVLIGSSAGGPGPLRELLAQLPAAFSAPLLVAQHIAPGFELGLAQWLSASCALRISIARDGAALEPGQVLIGPSGSDLLLQLKDRVTVQPPGSGTFHPSVDALFSTAARTFGAKAIGVILSGIGSDGLNGARELVAAGGSVISQDRRSCAVYGMPAAVQRARLSAVVGAPAALAEHLLEALG